MSKAGNQLSRNTLNELFGSKVRVKALRFLFRNYPEDFSVAELAKRIQEADDAVKKEIQSFVKIGLIRKKR